MKLELAKSATTVIHLNKSDLARAEVRIPSASQLLAFEECCEVMFMHSIALSQETRSLSALRDTLLPHLMSGRLRVKDAEAIVEEAL
jgi:type I restriction enzyme S subunit